MLLAPQEDRDNAKAVEEEESSFLLQQRRRIFSDVLVLSSLSGSRAAHILHLPAVSSSLELIAISCLPMLYLYVYPPPQLHSLRTLQLSTCTALTRLTRLSLAGALFSQLNSFSL